MMRRLLLLILLLCTLIISTQAQDGHGLIRIGVNNNLDTELTSLNPLLCDDTACDQVMDLLFPTLLAVDPDTNWYATGQSENNAMALDWSFSDDNQVVTFRLRDDALWSDGKAITAYDYFYNFLAIKSSLNTGFFYSRVSTKEYIEGVVPVTDYELAVILKAPACDSLTEADLQFIPAHAFDTTFADTAAEFFSEGDDIRQQWEAWEESFDYDFSFMYDHPFNEMPLVTGESFQFVDWDHRQHIRLKHGDIAIEFVPASSDTEQVDRLLEGDLSLIDDIPFERLADFANNPNIQVHEYPVQLWTYIAFNLADPDEPMSAFDDDGNPQEQGEHPILSNPDIRRAIHLGIDRQELINTASHGLGEIFPAYFTSSSWAYNPDLALPEYNADEAARLLDEAGWVQVGNQAIRECVHCGNFDDGTQLNLSLGYIGSRQYPIEAILIAQQLRRIGIGVNSYSTSYSDAFAQRFDLFMGIGGENMPSAGRLHDMLTPEEDVLGSGLNFGSYNNPELSAILDDARNVQGCDLDERRSLFAQAETIIQEDLPYTPLYAEKWAVALNRDIQNVSIFTGERFWNVDDWVVFDVH